MSFGNQEGQAPRLLDNPVSIRALAHPVRLLIRDMLIRDGPMTSTEIGEALGISQALASHHTRQLVKYNFVVEAAARDQREHRWRAADSSISVADDGSSAGGSPLEELYVERALARLTHWQRTRADHDEEWRDQAGIIDQLLYLTADELAALREEILSALGRYADRNADPDRRPPGARPAAVLAMMTPIDQTPRGN